ncbi:hypothetical protein BD770DRAFT_410000 [Pilaira anomala]|nr:hypothetical protein BD770DRAFT_410000 [Pilaira anomala]
MNSITNKPVVNILLFGLPKVGKSSLCQAFGHEYSEQKGFSFGFGFSRRAKVVEFVNEKCVYRIIDAPGIYDPQNEAETQSHANEMNRNLNLSSSTPYIICFVIRIKENIMLVDPRDFIMMKTISRCYNQGQVKFSLIINRLTENGFTDIANNFQFRRGFLESFKRNGNVSITEDNILFIRDGFLSYSKEGQRELLSFYLKKFEAVYLPEFSELSLELYCCSNNSPPAAELYLEKLYVTLARVEVLLKELEGRRKLAIMGDMVEQQNIYKQETLETKLKEQQLQQEIQGIVDHSHSYPKPPASVATGSNHQQLSKTKKFSGAIQEFLAGAMGRPHTPSGINPIFHTAGAITTATATTVTAVSTAVATAGCSIM